MPIGLNGIAFCWSSSDVWRKARSVKLEPVDHLQLKILNFKID